MIDGWSLSNVAAFSAQSAVIVAGGALIAMLVRIDAPGVRYFYWRTLAVLCLVLPWLQRYQEIPAPAGAAAGGRGRRSGPRHRHLLGRGTSWRAG